MLSVVIPTQNSERALLPTLAALIPGAAAGLVREVIIADAGSSDATCAVADAAGCEILVSAAPLGGRLRSAAASARSSWLMFLRPGTVPDTNWFAETARFLETAELRGRLDRAATFRPASADTTRPVLMEALLLMRLALGGRLRPEQGLVIGKGFYDRLGGHRADVADAEAEFFVRLGRRRVALLRSGAMTVTE
jgi:hypothetical protein